LIELVGESNKIKVLASSLGGGKVEVQELEGYPLKFSGERPTLVIRHSDRKGVIEELSRIMQKKGFNIARMGNERSKINGPAITICEVDNPVDESLLALLKRVIPIIEEILLVQTV
jgi:L-serine dehydratase